MRTLARPTRSNGYHQRYGTPVGGKRHTESLISHTPDVLNVDLSTWGENGVPMRWVIQDNKLTGREFFHVGRQKISVSHRLVTALRKAGITGINPKPVRMDC